MTMTAVSMHDIHYYVVGIDAVTEPSVISVSTSVFQPEVEEIIPPSVVLRPSTFIPMA